MRSYLGRSGSYFLILLALVSLSRSLVVQERQQSYCENTPTSRGCWGNYNLSTNYLKVTPDTGVTREYWLVAENRTLAPDGYERQVLVFNGTSPGPLIEANWGDNIVIHVTNTMKHNGTAVHWHGIHQRNTNQYDGVPGVTQCPIAPGETMTYKFRATQYGTSWYHSHFSLQMADGLYGPIVIHGPASADYDIDLGPVFVTEWFHKSAFILWEEHTRYGGVPVRTNAIAENGLINGTNTYQCPDNSDPACLGTGKRSEVFFKKGKKHLIRVIDSGVDGWMKFSIDGHKLTVIAADFVPIKPYTTDSIILTSGQRYDVIVEADQNIGNYWMRSIYQTACNGLEIDSNDIKGIIRYEGAPITDPTTDQWDSITDSCGDEPYDKLVPYMPLMVGDPSSKKNLNVGWYYELDLVFHWTLNTKGLTLDWGNPTDYLIYNNESVFPTEYNIYDVPQKNKWTYWVLQDVGIVNAYHPFHLHGHDFFILAQGWGLYNELTVKLNRDNPPRRDTATMQGSGYLVIAFETDNPGSWLMHCHLAWHASQSLALQFVERDSEIPGLIEPISEEFRDQCEKWDEYYATSVYHQDDSGI